MGQWQRPDQRLEHSLKNSTCELRSCVYVHRSPQSTAAKTDECMRGLVACLAHGRGVDVGELQSHLLQLVLGKVGGSYAEANRSYQGLHGRERERTANCSRNLNWYYACTYVCTLYSTL